MSAFTPNQSAEIDLRIIEMVRAVMGDGQYVRACENIAARRSQKVCEDHERKLRIRDLEAELAKLRGEA